MQASLEFIKEQALNNKNMFYEMPNNRSMQLYRISPSKKQKVLKWNKPTTSETNERKVSMHHKIDPQMSWALSSYKQMIQKLLLTI